MAKIYVSLIKKGLKTIDDVPAALLDEVKKLLGEQECYCVSLELIYSLSDGRGWKTWLLSMWR